MHTPQFCPNPLCPNHHDPQASVSWFRCIGYYPTAAFGSVHRYRCKICEISFSDQTFRLDYYVKQPLSYQAIFERITNGSGVRAIGRNLSVSHQTISNRIGRLARQAMAVHARLTHDIILQEPVVIGGYECFAGRRDQLGIIHMLAGYQSQFLYAYEYERIRGEKKYQHREESFDMSVLRLRAEFERLANTWKAKKAVIDIPGTIENKMRKNEEIVRSRMIMKYLGRQIRKDNANHVKQTVQYCRDVNNSLERMAVYQLQHNYVKPYRISECIADRQQSSLLHGQVAGIERERIEQEIKNIFEMRRFFTQVRLTFSQLLVWARMVGNPNRFCGGYWPQYIWM